MSFISSSVDPNTMTQTIELGKAQFFTIEAFYFELKDGYCYEEERCEAVDTYWFAQMGGKLEEYMKQECYNNLDKNEHVRVSLIPRRWATIVDGEREDYGDECLGREDYIWNGSELITEEEYITEASKVSQ
jgi:hypothetical protein